MATQRDPRQVLKEAKQIATDHGCFVQEKAGRFNVFRKTAMRPVYLGTRKDPSALRAFVCKVTNFH